LDWDRALTPVFGARRERGWRAERLTINYRTPASIMTQAETIARAAGIPVAEAISPREVPDAFARIHGGADPVSVTLDTARALTRDTDGRLAVIVAHDAIEQVRRAVERSDLAAMASGPSILDSRLAVLTPAEVKGLEFDDVIVLDPDAVAAGPGGARDLYVAMTRSTRRLRLVER
jgi:DNA helicase IV